MVLFSCPFPAHQLDDAVPGVTPGFGRRIRRGGRGPQRPLVAGVHLGEGQGHPRQGGPDPGPGEGHPRPPQAERGEQREQQADDVST